MSIDLNKINGCQIHKYVNEIIGLNRNSTSPTDTWILKFNKNIKFKLTEDDENGKRINFGFMKLWLDSENYKYLCKRRIGINYDSIIYEQLQSLKYEESIYKYFINYVLYKNICPHFVRYLSGGDNCTFNSMGSFLKGKFIEGKLMDDDVLETNFTRNIYSSITNDENRRNIGYIKNPLSFDSAAEKRKDIAANNILKEFGNNVPTFNFIISEAIDSTNTKTFFNYIRNRDTTKPYSIGEWSVFFQILYGCFIMEKFGVSHNDLHSSNIWIEETKRRYITYKINGNVYTFTTKNNAMIYDFDRSYWNIKGNNPSIDDYLCDKHLICNTVTSRRDFLQVAQVIFIGSTDWQSRKLLCDCLIKDENDYHKFVKLFSSKKGYCLLPDTNHKLKINDKFFEMLYSIEEIIDNISKLANCNKSGKGEVYTFNDRMIKDLVKIMSKGGEIAKSKRSVKRALPKRSSPKSKRSVKRALPKRSSPKSKRSVKRASPKRSSLKRASSKRASSKRASPKSRKSVKICPSHKIYNEKSNRCVLLTGKIGKSILNKSRNKSPKRASPKRASPKSRKSVKICPSHKIYNEKSNRCVLLTGKIGKSILKNKLK
jgi:hypothetical protein